MISLKSRKEDVVSAPVSEEEHLRVKQLFEVRSTAAREAVFIACRSATYSVFNVSTHVST